MKVSQSEIGQIYCVSDIQLDDKTSRRLEVIGMTKGTHIEVINKRPSGAVIIKVRGTRFAMGKRLADNIFLGGDCNEK